MNENTRVTIERKIFKFGTSHAVIIPAQLNPEPGETVEITINKPVTSV